MGMPMQQAHPVKPVPPDQSAISSSYLSSGYESTIRPQSRLRRQESLKSGSALTNKYASPQTISTVSSTDDSVESIARTNIPGSKGGPTPSRRAASQATSAISSATSSTDDCAESVERGMPTPRAGSLRTQREVDPGYKIHPQPQANAAPASNGSTTTYDDTNAAQSVLQQARRDLQSRIAPPQRQAESQKPSLLSRIFGKRNDDAQESQTSRPSSRRIHRSQTQGDDGTRSARHFPQQDRLNASLTTARSEPSMRQQYFQHGKPGRSADAHRDPSYIHPDDHPSQFPSHRRRRRHRRRHSSKQESAEDFKARRLDEERVRAGRLDRDIAVARRGVDDAEERAFASDTRAAIEQSQHLDPHEQWQEDNMMRQAVIASLEHQTSWLNSAAGQTLRKVKVVYDGCKHSIMDDGELYMDKGDRLPPKVVHRQGVCDSCQIEIRSQTTASPSRMSSARGAVRQPLASLPINLLNEGQLHRRSVDNDDAAIPASGNQEAGKARSRVSLGRKSLSALQTKQTHLQQQQYEPSESPTMTSEERDARRRAPPSFASTTRRRRLSEHDGSKRTPSIAASEGVPASVAFRSRTAEEASRRRLFDDYNREWEAHLRRHPEDASTVDGTAKVRDVGAAELVEQAEHSTVKGRRAHE